MTREEFILKYKDRLFDKKGRVNGNLLRFKDFDEINKLLLEFTPFCPIEALVSERVLMIFNNIDHWGECEVCKKPTKYLTKTKSFTPFCGNKCSRTPGCSTFTKAQATCLKLYGVKSNLAMSSNIEAIKEKYGGIGSGSPIISERIKKTNNEKFGCDNPWGNQEVIKTIRQTNNNRYGADSWNQKDLGEFLEFLENEDNIKEVVDSELCFSNWAVKLGVTPTTLIKHLSKRGVSIHRKKYSGLELMIYETLNLLPIDIVRNNRTILKKFEIDLLINNTLGIEIDGIYWHSEIFEKSEDKRNKQKLAIEQGIEIIHIFEDEIIHKYDIVISKIKNKLKIYDREISAYECTLELIENDSKKVFLEFNDINGNIEKDTINVGLIYKGQLEYLVCLIETNLGFEIVRNCNSLNTNIKNAVDVILNDIKSLGTMYTYNCLRWNDNVYRNNISIEYVDPKFKYFKSKFGIIRHDENIFSGDISNSEYIGIYNCEISKDENIKANGWMKVFDCGYDLMILN